MYAAQRSLLRIKRNIALHQLWVQSVAFEFLLAPTAREEASLVESGLEVNFENPDILVS